MKRRGVIDAWSVAGGFSLLVAWGLGFGVCGGSGVFCFSQSRVAGAASPVPPDLRVGAPALHVAQRAIRPAPATHAFKAAWLKADPAFGRSDISHCSDAVFGSPFLTREILECHATVDGDLATQVATKRLSGSRIDVFISGLLRSNTQREQCSSWWCGDLEAGGRAPA